MNVEAYSLSKNIQPVRGRVFNYLSQICLTLDTSSFYYMSLLLYKYVCLLLVFARPRDLESGIWATVS